MPTADETADVEALAVWFVKKIKYTRLNIQNTSQVWLSVTLIHFDTISIEALCSTNKVKNLCTYH